MEITIKSNEGKTNTQNKSPAPLWQDYPQKISVLVMFMITVVFNVLSSIGTVGATQTELSGKYTTFLTPPGYTFSIWGLIYSFWALLVVCQMAPNKYLSNPKLFYAKSFKGTVKNLTELMGGFLSLNCFISKFLGLWVWLCLSLVFNSLWCVTFAQDSDVGMVFQVLWMLAYVACLGVIILELFIFQRFFKT